MKKLSSIPRRRADLDKVAKLDVSENAKQRYLRMFYTSLDNNVLLPVGGGIEDEKNKVGRKLYWA